MQDSAQPFQNSQLRAMPRVAPESDTSGFNPSPKTGPKIPVDSLAALVEDWQTDCRIRNHSQQSLKERGATVRLLLKYLSENNYPSCGKPELRSFFLHLANGHNNREGRWGYGDERGGGKELRPATTETYYRRIHAFYSWLVAEGYLEQVPLSKTWLPATADSQIVPFMPEQIERLYQAACASRHPRRDDALFLFMLSTGLRASEVVNLKMADVDLFGRSVRVVQGKGKKDRTVSMGADASKSVRAYVTAVKRPPNGYLFLSERGGKGSGRLTRSGLGQIVERWAITAGVTGVRCSPHTFRHTFAIMFLNNNGHIRALQAILGHSNIKMTMKYLNLADADQQNQHRKYDVVDSLNLRK